MKEVNKVLIVMSIFFLFAISIVLDNNSQPKEMFQIGALQIDKENFNNIMKDMPEGGMQICSISQNKCVNFMKQKVE